jgi:hypothetical protein
MRSFQILALVALSGWQLAGSVRAEAYKLANGNVLRGEFASADEDGLVVKLDVGGFSKREPWINFSQETLRELAKNPKAAPFVEPFIELPLEEIKAREKEKEIVVKPVLERMERPAEKPGLLAAFATPIGLALLAVLMLGNLFAAFEIAIFRNQPVPLVCGLAILFPIVGPFIFLCLPTRAHHAAPAEGTLSDAQFDTTHAAAAPPAPESKGGLTSRMKSKITSVFQGKRAGGLTLASASKAETAPGSSEAQVYGRGEYTFNRRFFETKFPGFFRVVPSEAERDLVIVIKAIRSEYVGKRISRISSNEMHIQALSGAEVMIPFAEITQIQIRHKDAKG